VHGRNQRQPGEIAIVTITGEALAKARHQARMTQQALAEALGKSERSIAVWEQNGVPAGREGLVMDVLGQFLRTNDARRPLADFADAELIAELSRLTVEIARRLGERPQSVSTVVQDGPESDPSGEINDDPSTSGLRYGNTGKPGRRRTPQE
jgi:transcriptional regulator with XRE-family HTH domain